MPKIKNLPQAAERGERRVTVGELRIALERLVGLEPGVVGTEVIPRSKTRRVQLIWPNIAYALNRGYKPREIWEPLAAAGIDISSNDFRKYVGRVRKNQEKRPQQEQRKIEFVASGDGESRPAAQAQSSARVIEPIGEDQPGEARPPLSDNARRVLEVLQHKGPEWPTKPKSLEELFK